MAVATGINARGSTFSVPLYGRIRGTGGSAGSFNDPPATLVDKNGLYVPSQFPSVVYAQAVVPIANAAVLTLNTVGVQLVAAQGPGTYIVVDTITLNNIFSTATYTSGGAIGGYYGGPSGTGTLGTPTIPATFLVGPTTNQIALTSGAIATIAGSVAENAALWLSCATGNFASGGGSLIAVVNYQVISGLS